MATSTTHLRPRVLSLYRSLLREMPSRQLSNPSPLKQRLRSRFVDEVSLSTTPSSSVAVEELGVLEERLETAEQFVKYARAQRMYTTLLDRYNPGEEFDQEERVRLSARRVGMNLPAENYKDNNTNDGSGGGNKGSSGSG
jgi:ATP synthase assembly factor FMC1